MASVSSDSDNKRSDKVIRDFAPSSMEPSADGACVLPPIETGLADYCEAIVQRLADNQVVFHPHCGDSPIHDELLKEDSDVRILIGNDFHRLVVLDFARGIASGKRFDLATFHQYALAQFCQAFGIQPPATVSEVELLQILRDQPRSLLCLVNADIPRRRERKRLQCLTSEGHSVLIVYRVPDEASGKPSISRAHLLQDGHGLPEKRIPLLGVTTIGRHPGCGIVLDAGAVSRSHAKIVSKDEGFILVDTGSSNGTFLNGHRVSKPVQLSDLDRIRISDFDFVFHCETIPEFDPGGAMKPGSAKFGTIIIDDSSSDPDDSGGSSIIEIRSSSDILKMIASPEAKLKALMQINRNLNNALAIDEVLPKVLSSLFDIFPAADRGFVILLDDEGKVVPRWVKTRRELDETETVRISSTIIHQVMSSGETILSSDALVDSRFDSSESVADVAIRSMICAPLNDGEGQAFGALQIDSSRGEGQFRDEDTDLFSGVAAQASIVINNARMYEQALQQKEVEQDLKIAKEVQRAFLPQSPPEAPGFRVVSYYQAANHVGGDYYDYIQLADDRVALVVADVVGHGVAAAMFMAKLSAETSYCLASEADVAKAVMRLNDRMSGMHLDRFVTFLLIVIDPSSEMVTIVNAGHMPPIVRKADGSLFEPGGEESGLPIAIEGGIKYEAVDFPIGVGDMMVMYTDGINESMNSADEEFGRARLRKLIAAGGDADEVKDRIINGVMDFAESTPPLDDMCLVVVERIECGLDSK